MNVLTRHIAETFKLEDIYANLYNIKGQLIWKREHRRGEPFDRITKFTNGTLLFIALLFVILVPLLLFSSANPVNVQNNVSSGTLTVSLAVANIGTVGARPVLALLHASTLCRYVVSSDADVGIEAEWNSTQ